MNKNIAFSQRVQHACVPCSLHGFARSDVYQPHAISEEGVLLGCSRFSKMRAVRVSLLGGCRVASRVMVKGSLEPYLWKMSADGIT